jgi:hypothetical protein
VVGSVVAQAQRLRNPRNLEALLEFATDLVANEARQR